MTTKPPARAASIPGYVQLPDPPEPEDMNNYLFLHSPGNSHFLAMHFGNEDTTIVLGDTYATPEPTASRQGIFHPDLLIAFDADPAAARERNGYVISEQGKPPDFVLEVGSRYTGRRDVTVKREGYAALGIPEYWRFDNSGGRHHGTPLAGDRLVNGVYQPIAIEQLDDRTHQGYSGVLDLYLRWEDGNLGWYDPATGRHIPRFSDERERAEAEQARAESERETGGGRASQGRIGKGTGGPGRSQDPGIGSRTPPPSALTTGFPLWHCPAFHDPGDDESREDTPSPPCVYLRPTEPW